MATEVGRGAAYGLELICSRRVMGMRRMGRVSGIQAEKDAKASQTLLGSRAFADFELWAYGDDSRGRWPIRSTSSLWRAISGKGANRQRRCAGPLGLEGGEKGMGK